MPAVPPPKDEPLAKLHDLLKLGDSDYHWCPMKHTRAGDMESAHPDLWKALRHHCVSWSWRHGCRLQMDRETFCISYADQKASAISRRLRKAHTSHRVYHVWKDELGDDEKFEPIRGIFEEAMRCTDLRELYAKYQHKMEKRAESANPRDGSSFTSLQTHAELTASWADFLLRNADRYGLPKDVGSAYSFRKPIEKGEVVLVRCKICTHGRLARLRDLQMVRDIEIRKRLAIKALGRVSLCELPDEILVPLHPDFHEQIPDLLKPTLSTNHFIHFVAVPTRFLNAKGEGKGFLYNFDKLFGGFRNTAYPHLEDKIKPDDRYPASSHAIICDLCQMAQARVEYHDEFPGSADPVTEYLCDSCAALRRRSQTKAPNLATWERTLDEEETEGPKGRPRVCMVKVSLDMDELVTALQDGFKATFPEKLKDRQLGGHDLGFSILREFVLDYNRFVKKFEESILALDNRRYSDDNSDLILDGFMALRIDKDSEVAQITRKYVELYDKYFPRLKGPVFPIKLSVSCSPIKYPFLEHWEVLDRPKSAINVQSVRRATLSVSFEEFEALEEIGIDQNRRVSSFLHDLAEIEARTGSRLLVKFALLEKHRDAEAVAAPFMSGKVKQIEKILSYYKLFAQDGRR